jgi:hypothetical protein
LFLMPDNQNLRGKMLVRQFPMCPNYQTNDGSTFGGSS